MKEIRKGFVYSEDIKRIFEGINAFDYKYNVVPDSETIKSLRGDLFDQINQIFNNEVTVISEDEMLLVNNFIGGDYPHCYIR